MHSVTDSGACGCLPPRLTCAIEDLRRWVESREYCGHEPYDLLNAPALSRVWNCSALASAILIQAGRRYAGLRTRVLLRVPESRNPKALGLFLSAYCDLVRQGHACTSEITFIKRELKRLSAPTEAEFSWGYDWNFVSRRGSVMPAYAPNAIATVFCAEALLDAADISGDTECEVMAASAARFCVNRLNRSADSADELCFSYTTQNQTQIFNSSALVAAFLARCGRRGRPAYFDLAHRAMVFLCRRQRHDGAWAYGVLKKQQWVDGFHTAYNLCALRSYARQTGNSSFNDSIARGYEFYRTRCFTSDGIPKYFEDRIYPIDIHACSQAILTFVEFASQDPLALSRAFRVAEWTLDNMRSEDGSFHYQRHRFWKNETPYMRWGQAWMLRALARLSAVARYQGTHDENMD